MAGESSFGELVRKFRRAAGLTQPQLAEAASVSLSRIQSYEQGRRFPDAAAIEQLRRPLRLSVEAYDALRRAAGVRAVPSGFQAALKEGRAAPDTVWDEVQDCEWVSLVLNERREVVAWNRLANRTGEIDLGTLTQFERSVLRMAATEHYDRHLTNWEVLIGRLISFFKMEGNDVSAGQPAEFVQAVLEDIARKEDRRFVDRIFSLFLSAPPWRDEDRNIHPIEWELDDGTGLRFHGAFADWSHYDGMWAFDWHAADAATATWVQQELMRPGGDSKPPVSLPFAASLAVARGDARKSRPALAALSGISAASIAAYESGSRRPSRPALLALCRALAIDGYATNRFLREAGFEEEPSDLARWLAGETPISIFRGHTPLRELGSGPIFASCDSLPWPCVILDAGCHIVHTNTLAERVVSANRWKPLPGRPGLHLVQLMTSDAFLEQVRNWETVAGVILPGRLEPLVLGARGDASSKSLKSVAEHLRRSQATGLARLASVWKTSPGFSSLRRPGVRFEWTTEEGDELLFNCVISGWGAFDPYKALDLFPADAATFAWLEGGEREASLVAGVRHSL